MDFGGDSDYVDTAVYTSPIQAMSQPMSQPVSQDTGVGWIFAAVLGLGAGYFVVTSLSVGGKEAQYAAELEEELGEVELEAAEKVEDSQKRKSNVDAKTVADKREQRREMNAIADYVTKKDPETAKAAELKQKHAEQDKWDAKKAKWERKAAAAAETTDETVDMDDEDENVN
jgi:hypothetical protein